MRNNIAIYAPEPIDKKVAERSLELVGENITDRYHTGDYYTYNKDVDNWSRTDFPFDCEIIISPDEIVEHFDPFLI